MTEFVENKHYYFIGSKNMVEKFIIFDCFDNNNIYLGKFIEYIGVSYVNEWIHDGKARFEFGIIHKCHYDKVCLL